MTRRRAAILGFFTLATVFGAAACEDEASQNPDARVRFVSFVDCATARPAATVQWYLGAPAMDVTIATNQVVRFVVTDAYTHTLTSGTSPDADGLFDVAIAAGTPKCVQFAAPGDYPFFCTVHPAMTGVIHVK